MNESLLTVWVQEGSQYHHFFNLLKVALKVSYTIWKLIRWK